jgi:lipid II:glycine glycyltransferase (peptidoglycan interpeptide bridge formation enzyme)
METIDQEKCNGFVRRELPPSFTSEVDTVSDQQWDELVDRFQDANLYQTRSYGQTRWGAKSLSRIVLKKNGEPVSIAQLRLKSIPGVKLGVAYLRWGPLWQLKGGELDELVIRTMAGALKEHYAVQRRMFLQVIPNAYVGTRRAELFQAGFGGYRSSSFAPGSTYRTFVLDLDKPLDQLRRNLDQKWRNMLNSAEKKQLIISEGEGEEQFRRFAGLYQEMYARKQFASAARIEDFAKMQQALPPGQKMRVLLCEENGVLVSGVVVTGIGNCGIYLHGATSNEGLKARGSYRLQWEVIKWLKQKGVHFYDLGGINPNTNPGVYHFKAGMAGQDSLYASPVWIAEGLLGRVIGNLYFLARRNPRIIKVLRNS